MILGAIGAQIALMALLNPYRDQLQAWILPIAGVPFLLALFVAVWITRRRTRRRIKRIAEALRPEQVDFVDEPSDAIRQLVAPHMAGLQNAFNLRDGVTNIVWVAYNSQMLLFEHEFTTGSGRNIQVHTHTVIALAPHPELPQEQQLGYQAWFWARRLRFGQGRVLKAQWGAEFEIGDPEFDKLWALYGSPETAQTVLTQPVRQLLLNSPKGETWFVGNGWVAIGYDGNLTDTNFLAMLKHARSVLNAI